METIKVQDLTKTLPKNPARPEIPIRNKAIRRIVWHCDAAGTWDVRDLIEYDLHPNHLSKHGCPCPTYAYWIDRNGLIYKIAQEAWETWHVGPRAVYQGIENWNKTSLGICLSLNPATQAGPTAPQLRAARLLTVEILRRRKLTSSDVVGHYELPGTGYVPGHPERRLKSCPGFDMRPQRTALHALLQSGTQVLIAP